MKDSEQDWRAESYAEIDKLPAEMHAYNGKPPNSSTVQRARDVVVKLRHRPKVIPMADGGIALVYGTTAENETRVEIENDSDMVLVRKLSYSVFQSTKAVAVQVNCYLEAAQ